MLDELQWPSFRENRVVIMGCGQIGSSVANTMAGGQGSVHVIDKDPSAFGLLPEALIDDGRILALVGDGTLESDLRRANAQDCDIFIAVSGKDASNALAAQIAKIIFQVETVICRMNDQPSKNMYAEAGIVAISVAEMATNAIIKFSGTD